MISKSLEFIAYFSVFIYVCALHNAHSYIIYYSISFCRLHISTKIVCGLKSGKNAQLSLPSSYENVVSECLLYSVHTHILRMTLVEKCMT